MTYKETLDEVGRVLGNVAFGGLIEEEDICMFTTSYNPSWVYKELREREEEMKKVESRNSLEGRGLMEKETLVALLKTMIKNGVSPRIASGYKWKWIAENWDELGGERYIHTGGSTCPLCWEHTHCRNCPLYIEGERCGGGNSKWWRAGKSKQGAITFANYLLGWIGAGYGLAPADDSIWQKKEEEIMIKEGEGYHVEADEIFKNSHFGGELTRVKGEIRLRLPFPSEVEASNAMGRLLRKAGIEIKETRKKKLWGEDIVKKLWEATKGHCSGVYCDDCIFSCSNRGIDKGKGECGMNAIRDAIRDGTAEIEADF